VASALFLWLLELATDFRTGDEASCTCCPSRASLIGFVYERYGQSIKAGNNLVIDTIHDEGPEIPLRMAPMVLIGTVLTHLFGGSAGREGTAVQMGASLTDWVSHRLRVSRSHAATAAGGGRRGRLRLGVRDAHRRGRVRARVHRARAHRATTRWCPRWWRRWWAT
jgi:H+/Cl- antiporter ClcA